MSLKKESMCPLHSNINKKVYWFQRCSLFYTNNCRRKDRPLNQKNDRLCSCHFITPPTRNSSATLLPTIFYGKRKVTLLSDFPEPEVKKNRRGISYIIMFSFYKYNLPIIILFIACIF